MTYNTKQKDDILVRIKSKDKAFTVRELYDELDNIGLTTIYRFVDKLVNDGRINKYIGSDNVTYYQYIEECSCTHHYYLKCDDCGIMIHVDCEEIEPFTAHITEHHGFVPNMDRIIIHGLCKNCNKNTKENLC